MATKKTLECRDPACSYTARRPLIGGFGRGHRTAPAEYGRCPHGHGDLVERVTIPKNRKPAVSPDGRRRRYE